MMKSFVDSLSLFCGCSWMFYRKNEIRWASSNIEIECRVKFLVQLTPTTFYILHWNRNSCDDNFFYIIIHSITFQICHRKMKSKKKLNVVNSQFYVFLISKGIFRLLSANCGKSHVTLKLNCRNFPIPKRKIDDSVTIQSLPSLHLQDETLTTSIKDT